MGWGLVTAKGSNSRNYPYFVVNSAIRRIMGSKVEEVEQEGAMPFN